MNFSEKNVIITGARGSIGSKTAQLFLEYGAKVFCCDNTYDLKDYSKIMFNHNCNKVHLDVTDSNMVVDFFEAIHHGVGRIDIVVNSAGLLMVYDTLDVEEFEWQMIMDVNLKGTYLICKTALKYMMENRSGNIINIASISGKTGSTISAPQYSASKAGVICLTKSLAQIAALRGVRVNSIAPGGVEGDMVNFYRKKCFSEVNELIKNNPMRRFADPEEIAFPILFLASDMASYITGECLNVNGGALMD